MAEQNRCNDPVCCRPPIIYLDNQHIKRRNGHEKILGTKDQFCGAFYHVHKWDYREGTRYIRTREYLCLDDNNCIIAQRAQERDNEHLQPRDRVVAVVKFEDRRGRILYEARYTNCKNIHVKKHAEDFFKDDIESGDLAGIVGQRSSRKGTITMYLTLQPCNESTSPGGTQATPADKSCCETLKYIFRRILQRKRKKIGLCVKVTHTNHLGPGRESDEMHVKLRENAEKGIKDLTESGVSVERMTDVDWEYLFGLTSVSLPPRNDLDYTVGMILTNL